MPGRLLSAARVVAGRSAGSRARRSACCILVRLFYRCREKLVAERTLVSGPLLAAIVSGDEAVAVIRGLVGATDGRAAAAGTIRGDFSLSNRENLVHASDSVESAEREIKLWFPELI